MADRYPDHLWAEMAVSAATWFLALKTKINIGKNGFGKAGMYLQMNQC